MLKSKILIILLLITNFVIFSKAEQEVKKDGLSVVTSILPQKYFVERIGGDRVNCTVLVGPGKNPATYQPTPSQIVELGEATILFTIGVPFENAYLDKFTQSLNRLNIVDTSTGIEKNPISNHHHDEEEEGHEEGEEHEETEGSLDPHVWLSPVLAKTVAKNIYNTLVEYDPEGKEFYTQGYNSLLVDLDSINKELHEILKPYKGKILFVYHPSFGYFSKEYGLEQIAIETGGKEPTSSQLTHIIDEAIEESVKIIIVQPEFSQKSANIIANSINGTVTTLNPLDLDYINNLRSIANTIVGAYEL
ncbi:MAG: zinc ABC transporter substrate-binding protein [Spirochaetales bacterium]|nr:zinc ABC transporter substrate-binding protein [Spirochaetales bacterium]